MIDSDQNQQLENSAEEARVDEARRKALRRLGRFAAVTPPTIALILAAGTRPSKAGPGSVPSSRQFKEPVSITQLPKRA